MVDYYVLALCLLTIITPYLMSSKCDMRVPDWVSSIKPPDWAFGVIWTLLYSLMGVSLYLTLTSPYASFSNIPFTVCLVLTVIGYILNYSYIYMAGCKKDWTKAFRIIIAYLMILLPQTLMTFAISPIAGILISPTIGWIVVATVLNSFYVNMQDDLKMNA